MMWATLKIPHRTRRVEIHGDARQQLLRQEMALVLGHYVPGVGVEAGEGVLSPPRPLSLRTNYRQLPAQVEEDEGCAYRRVQTQLGLVPHGCGCFGAGVSAVKNGAYQWGPQRFSARPGVTCTSARMTLCKSVGTAVTRRWT